MALVPTPSVELTSTGWRYRAVSKAKAPPKPPMPPSTSGRAVEATTRLIRSTAASPAAMSTPAERYVAGSPALSGAATSDGGVDDPWPGRQCHRHGRHGHRHRVLAGQTGAAEARTRRVDRRHQVLERQVGEGVDPEEGLELGDRALGGHQVLAARDVDAVEARPHERRRG